MKIITTNVNQNVPIWSMLSGDHALKDIVDNINPKLIANPDFLNPLENSLRYEMFKNKRGWIAETIKKEASFGIIELTKSDFPILHTCFTEVPFELFSNEYKSAIKKDEGFEIKRKFKNSITKSRDGVRDVAALATKLSTIKQKKYSIENVLDPKLKNEENYLLALNRGIIKGDQSKTLTIMDATHRITAWAVGLEMFPKKMPKSIFAFYYKEV